MPTAKYSWLSENYEYFKTISPISNERKTERDIERNKETEWQRMEDELV